MGEDWCCHQKNHNLHPVISPDEHSLAPPPPAARPGFSVLGILFGTTPPPPRIGKVPVFVTSRGHSGSGSTQQAQERPRSSTRQEGNGQAIFLPGL